MQLAQAVRAFRPQIEDQQHVLAAILRERDGLPGGVADIQGWRFIRLPARRSEMVERHARVVALRRGRRVARRGRDAGGLGALQDFQPGVGVGGHEQQPGHVVLGLGLLAQRGVRAHQSGEREDVVAGQLQRLLEGLRRQHGTLGIQVRLAQTVVERLRIKRRVGILFLHVVFACGGVRQQSEAHYGVAGFAARNGESSLQLQRLRWCRSPPRPCSCPDPSSARHARRCSCRPSPDRLCPARRAPRSRPCSSCLHIRRARG